MKKRKKEDEKNDGGGDDKKEKQQPEDKVSDFFNSLSIIRGSEELGKFGGDGGSIVEITDEEYDMVAYPFPEITLIGGMSGFVTSTFIDSEGMSKTFKASNGKAFFTCRELGEALADFELQDGHYIFFEGLYGSNHTYSASWGS